METEIITQEERAATLIKEVGHDNAKKMALGIVRKSIKEQLYWERVYQLIRHDMQAKQSKQQPQQQPQQ